MTEDEMVGSHYQLNGHESEQTPGDGEGQGGLVSFSAWGHKESDMTHHLNSSIYWKSNFLPSPVRGSTLIEPAHPGQAP